MLTRLRLENFKAWRDSGDIRLAPLTVLFGTNSAGKTSIPQLLLLLKQTAESSDRQRALHLGDSHSIVDAGSFADIVHGHDLSQPLQFTLAWTLARALEFHDPLSGARYAGDNIKFTAALRGDARAQPRVDRFRYDLRDHEKQILALAMEQQPPAPGADATQSFSLRAEGIVLARVRDRADGLPAPLRFYGFPAEVQASYENAAFAADLALELERMLASIYYVGPLREYPRRLYLWSGEVPEHVGERGALAIEAILASGDRTFSLGPRQSPIQLPRLVAESLQKMGLIHEFEIHPLGTGRHEHEILVTTAPASPAVKLTDVGFGVSQVLPVIVECFYVPRRSIVIFEQPEVHLHPRAQAALADLFIDAIHARENDAPRDCQFIIQSHSEHFLRRLQRRVAEERLAREDAALYFVHSGATGAQVEELDVDDFGNIRNWPEHFFGDEMGDLVARTEAQARRMQQGSA